MLGMEPYGWIFWILIILFALFYPQLMVRQILFKLEHAANELERMSTEGRERVLKKIQRKPNAELEKKLKHFFEFFLIYPVSLDPYGIIQKLEYLLLLSEQRFKEFVSRVASHLHAEVQANVRMGMGIAIGLYQLAKMLRHYVELIKKTKSMQLALLVHMQLPFIQRFSKALSQGVEAVLNGWPIGDSIGSLIGAKLMGKAKVREVEVDTVAARQRIAGRSVIVLKAKGPGSRLGRLGRAVGRLASGVSRIIMVDAALKLEGERSGSVASGIGAAVGGIGVDKAHIESVATQRKIELNSVVIKLSQEEALQPMSLEILRAADQAIEAVKELIASAPLGKVMVVGVGNTVGIGNNAKAAEKAERVIKQVSRRLKQAKKI